MLARSRANLRAAAARAGCTRMSPVPSGEGCVRRGFRQRTSAPASPRKRRHRQAPQSPASAATTGKPQPPASAAVARGNRQGPRMYEMRGPCPVFGRWPAGCPAGWRLTRPAAGTGLPPEAPVSRFFLRSGVAPGLVPVSGSDVFLPPRPRAAQGFSGHGFKILYCPQLIHSRGPVVPSGRRFSTRPSTTFRTGSQRVRRPRQTRTPPQRERGRPRLPAHRAPGASVAAAAKL